MDETIKELFTNEWKQIMGILAGIPVSLQNVNTADLFLFESAAQPAAAEIGKRLRPAKSARIVRGGTNPIWGRSKSSTGIAFYDVIL